MWMEGWRFTSASALGAANPDPEVPKLRDSGRALTIQNVASGLGGVRGRSGL